MEAEKDKFENTALNELQDLLREEVDFTPANLYTPLQGHVIATFDVLYRGSVAHVGVDITSYPDTPLFTTTFTKKAAGVYVPGYFSFYEGPVVIAALEELKSSGIVPDLIVVDGHGTAHPRQFGLACYVGVKTGKPVMGIAKKSLLPFDKETLPAEKYGLCAIAIRQEQVGVAIRMQSNVNPVFISPGNRITLATAVETAKAMTSVYKNPDNLRRADAASRIVAD